jgi:hypothetical protein
MCDQSRVMAFGRLLIASAAMTLTDVCSHLMRPTLGRDACSFLQLGFRTMRSSRELNKRTQETFGAQNGRERVII